MRLQRTAGSRKCCPEDADAHAACAQLAFEQGEVSRAVELYRKVLRITPSYPGVRHNLGLALESLWMLDEAEEVLREQDQMECNNPHTINALANILRKKGLYDEALAAYHMLCACLLIHTRFEAISG